ncbi:hypothetical protein M426DRAFT_257973 [Hypoxylon sp. CI-4A]|nr:hypothetical protein M426DRAFT_257973 [Hypoxylon sp. CI-4A]
MIYRYPDSRTKNGPDSNQDAQLLKSDEEFSRSYYPADPFSAGLYHTSQTRVMGRMPMGNHMLISYQTPSNAAPHIPVGITNIDIDRETNIRLRAFATQVSNGKFEAWLYSWWDTKLWSAGMAYLERSPRIDDTCMQTGVYHTVETAGNYEPQPNRMARINFTTPFESPPKVVTWIQHIDLDRKSNWRMEVYPTDIDRNGFTIHVDHGEETTLYGGGVTWLAYPSTQRNIISGRFSTKDIKPWNGPVAENSDTFKFPYEFPQTPKIVVALDSFNYDCRANLRLDLGSSSVTNKSFTWHLNSWADSIMYSAGASFIAWVPESR